MDTMEMRARLQYVTELLEDLRHYHQTNSHACNCDVCTKKRSLLQSSLSKALEEVVSVAQCLGGSHGYDMGDQLDCVTDTVRGDERKDKHEYVTHDDISAGSNLNFSCSSLLSVAQECETASTENASNRMNSWNVGSSGLEANSDVHKRYPSGTEQKQFQGMFKSRDNTDTSLLCSTMKDSGMHTLLTSQAVSPVLSDDEHPPKTAHSQPQISLNSNQTNAAPKLATATSTQQLPDKQDCHSANCKEKFLVNASCGQIVPPVSPYSVFSQEQTSSLHPSIFSYGFSVSPQPQSAHTHPMHQANTDVAQANTPSQHLPSWMPNVFVPFPFVPLVPSPSLMQEFEKYRRYSEEFIRGVNFPQLETLEEQKNRTFSYPAHPPPMTPMTLHDLVSATAVYSSSATKKDKPSEPVGEGSQVGLGKGNITAQNMFMNTERSETPEQGAKPYLLSREKSEISNTPSQSRRSPHTSPSISTPLQDENDLSFGNISLQESQGTTHQKEQKSNLLGTTSHKSTCSPMLTVRESQSVQVLSGDSQEKQLDLKCKDNITNTGSQNLELDLSLKLDKLTIQPSLDDPVDSAATTATEKEETHHCSGQMASGEPSDTCNLPSSSSSAVDKISTNQEESETLSKFEKCDGDGFSSEHRQSDLPAQADHSSNHERKAPSKVLVREAKKSNDNSSNIVPATANITDMSISDSMWRPWEIKDNILGLISSESDDEEDLGDRENGVSEFSDETEKEHSSVQMSQRSASVSAQAMAKAQDRERSADLERDASTAGEPTIDHQVSEQPEMKEHNIRCEDDQSSASSQELQEATVLSKMSKKTDLFEEQEPQIKELECSNVKKLFDGPMNKASNGSFLAGECDTALNPCLLLNTCSAVTQKDEMAPGAENGIHNQQPNHQSSIQNQKNISEANETSSHVEKERLSSGNTNVKTSHEGSGSCTVHKIPEKHVDQNETGQEVESSSSDSSLKCLSNVDHSPRKGRKSDTVSKSPLITSFQPALNKTLDRNDKENMNTPTQGKEPKVKSSLLKMGVECHIRNNDTSNEDEGLSSKTEKSIQDLARTHTNKEDNTKTCKLKSSDDQESSSLTNQANLIPDEQPLYAAEQNAGELKRVSPPAEGREGSIPTEECLSKGKVTTPPRKKLQWGAPALWAEAYLLQDSHRRSVSPEGIGHREQNTSQKELQEAASLKSSAATCTDKDARVVSQLPIANNSPCTSSNSATAICHQMTKIKPGDGDKVHQTSADVPESCPGAQETDVAWAKPENQPRFRIKSKANLNHSLPLSFCAPSQSNIAKAPKPMNESYEANQSFPKMAKREQSGPTSGDEFADAAWEQDMVTDLQQVHMSAPGKPVPRNRRSIFGFSPPDPHQGQGHQKAGGINVSDEDQSLVGSKAVIEPNEPGYLETLWSLFDVSDDIGQTPTIQEVLFNCVTSSLCVVDPQRNGKIISVNESFQFLIGVHEKVVGQRLFRFIKVKDPLDNLGVSLPQSFILADGSLTSVAGKMVTCVDARGKEIAVSIWTVPFSPRPELTVCVVGVLTTIIAEVYLSRHGDVLMYSDPFEDIMGLSGLKASEKAEGVCTVPDLDFSETKSQHSVVQAADGATVPVTVVITAGSDDDGDHKLHKEAETSGAIYPATLSVATNVAGLMIIQSDGLIKSCDLNFFRINLGLSNLERKHKVSEFLSEVTKVSQSSAQSSKSSSPANEGKPNAHTDMVLEDVSRLHGGESDGAEMMEQDSGSSELALPRSCFSGLTDVNLDTDENSDESNDEDDENDRSIETESDTEYNERQHSFALPVGKHYLTPHHSSTPCKHGQLAQKHEPSQNDVIMENGIYVAFFQHGNGTLIPVTFKLSRMKTSLKGWLFCLWMYVHPKPKDDDDSDNDDDDDEAGEGCDDENSEGSEEDSEEDDEVGETCDEGELRRKLKHLHFDQTMDRTADASLGQLIMDQAGLNQSHNATSGADMLDLEAAIAGSFSKKYMVLEALGQGSFGFVRRARIIGSTKSAVVKFIKKSRMFEDSWIADGHNGDRLLPLEVVILRETNCDYVIKLLDVHDNISFVQMVMEDFGDMDLFDFIDQVDIDEQLACYLFRQILWAVDYLHSHNIIHRDIKDENVIVSRDFHCKLIDFGSAAYMLPEGKFFTRFRGTMEYCSPEVYSGGCYRGPELDMWALGVTLYTIVFRENPFTATEMPGQLLETELPHPVTEDLVTLLLGLLRPNPSKRYTMFQALSSEWLRKIVDMNQYNWHQMFGGESESAPLECDLNMTTD